MWAPQVVEVVTQVGVCGERGRGGGGRVGGGSGSGWVVVVETDLTCPSPPEVGSMTKPVDTHTHPILQQKEGLLFSPDLNYTRFSAMLIYFKGDVVGLTNPLNVGAI